MKATSEISDLDAADQITVTVTYKSTKRFAIRHYIASRIVLIAVWIADKIAPYHLRAEEERSCDNCSCSDT